MNKEQKTWPIYVRTWKKAKPPLRPSKKTLVVIENYLDQKIKQKGSETKVLILGSTPEFRSLVISKELIPTVADFSETIYKGWGTMRTHKGKERFIKQDWREINLKEKFDIILAEASMTVLSKKDMPRFLSKQAELLAQDGYFLNKVWVYLPDKIKSMEEIVKHYRKYHKGKHFMSIYSPLIYTWFCDQKKNETISLQELYFTFKQLYESGILTTKEFSSIKDFGHENSLLQLCLPPKAEIIKLIKHYFNIQSTRITEHPFGEICPLFVLTHKV